MRGKYSEKFIADAIIVLNIYHEMFSKCRIYEDHERKIAHEFDDKKYTTEYDALLQSKIRKLKVRYMLKYSSVSPGNELHTEFMTMLGELQKGLTDVKEEGAQRE